MQAAKLQCPKWIGFCALAVLILTMTWAQHAQAVLNCQARQCIEVGASTAVIKDGKVQYYATCVVYAGTPNNPYLAEGWTQPTAHDNFYGQDSKGGKAQNNMNMKRLTGKTLHPDCTTQFPCSGTRLVQVTIGEQEVPMPTKCVTKEPSKAPAP